MYSIVTAFWNIWIQSNCISHSLHSLTRIVSEMDYQIPLAATHYHACDIYSISHWIFGWRKIVLVALLGNFIRHGSWNFLNLKNNKFCLLDTKSPDPVFNICWFIIFKEIGSTFLKSSSPPLFLYNTQWDYQCYIDLWLALRNVQSNNYR